VSRARRIFGASAAKYKVNVIVVNNWNTTPTVLPANPRACRPLSCSHVRTAASNWSPSAASLLLMVTPSVC
jgi:hypothetical protein